jgi:transcriptional regulator with XRE-family HTH domain
MKPETKSTPQGEYHERLMQTFGDRLRAARESKYDSAERFAFALGMRPHAYRKYERGQSWPGPATLMRICELLEVTPNDLLLDAIKRRAKSPRKAGRLTAAPAA